MTKYYAYKLTKEGKEPMGTQDRILFELKTNRGAIARALRILGKGCRVYRYRNFYDNSTFHCIQA